MLSADDPPRYLGPMVQQRIHVQNGSSLQGTMIVFQGKACFSDDRREAIVLAGP